MILNWRDVFGIALGAYLGVMLGHAQMKLWSWWKSRQAGAADETKRSLGPPDTICPRCGAYIMNEQG